MARDRLRQWANVGAAFAQPAVTALAFGTGTSFEESAGDAAGPTLIEPAGYAFAVWGPIYLGSIVYAVYQALPA